MKLEPHPQGREGLDWQLTMNWKEGDALELAVGRALRYHDGTGESKNGYRIKVIIKETEHQH